MFFFSVWEPSQLWKCKSKPRCQQKEIFNSMNKLWAVAFLNFTFLNNPNVNLDGRFRFLFYSSFEFFYFYHAQRNVSIVKKFSARKIIFKKIREQCLLNDLPSCTWNIVDIVFVSNWKSSAQVEHLLHLPVLCDWWIVMDSLRKWDSGELWKIHGR
jgi:hypothetical protein